MPNPISNALHTLPPMRVHCFLRYANICVLAMLCTLVDAQPRSATLTSTLVPPKPEVSAWIAQFNEQVDRRLNVPQDQQARYVALLAQTVAQADIELLAPQVFVLVDRNPNVQAAFIVVYLQGVWQWIGATSVSTGKVGSYEHFVTPLGVFAHTLDNPDFRAEGTYNQNHIRGYGLKGLRVFDFGWQFAERGWGVGGSSQMRLQMHATDPATLEQRLGSVQSEGCIRIPSSLNVFLDMHGVLDAAYQEAVQRGDSLWVLKADRTPVAWPGRYMVIVDSQVLARPDWSADPAVLLKAKAEGATNRLLQQTRLQPVVTQTVKRNTL